MIDIDQHRAIQLPEYDNSWWVRLQSVAGSLEGKLHLPAKERGKLIIFEPGFPGGGSTDLEKLHVAGLLQEGYAIFAARHNGTIINGKHSHLLLTNLFLLDTRLVPWLRSGQQSSWLSNSQRRCVG